MCASRVFSSFSNVRGSSWRAATISATNSTNSGTRGKLGVRYYLRGLPRGSALAVWLPERAFEIISMFQCLCSGARTCWWLCSWYLAVINPSSPHCLICTFTLNIIGTFLLNLLNLFKCLLHVISFKVVHKNISILREVVFLNPH